MLYWICVEFLEKIWKGNKRMKTSDITHPPGRACPFSIWHAYDERRVGGGSGNRMKRILEKLTANRFLGIAVGAGITASYSLPQRLLLW